MYDSPSGLAPKSGIERDGTICKPGRILVTATGTPEGENETRTSRPRPRFLQSKLYQLLFRFRRFWLDTSRYLVNRNTEIDYESPGVWYHLVDDPPVCQIF